MRVKVEIRRSVEEVRRWKAPKVERRDLRVLC